MATISEIISNAYVASFLCAAYNEKEKLFSPVNANPLSTTDIQMVSQGLYWGTLNSSSTTESLVSVSNYLIWLSGKFYLEATAFTGSGGGSVTPVIPEGLNPSRQDFYVQNDSYLPTGTTSKTLSAFIGYEIDFVRGGVSQSKLNTEPSYFTWNKLSGAFTCYPALIENELIAIIPTV